MKPLQLSTAPGIVWGLIAVASSVLFTSNDLQHSNDIQFYNETGGSYAYKQPYTNVFSNDIGAIRSFRKWFSAGIGINTFHFTDKLNNTWTIGLRPFARWYPLVTPKIKIYFEYGGGVSYSMNKFPQKGSETDKDTLRTGTKFNFISKYGAGVEIHLNNRVSLTAGLRHFHLSNGNMAGIDRNPSHDSNGYFIGCLINPRIN
ncbi:MAG TPA: acyloxyacyl hydrolase [Flavisolibacter sp.]|nr:acyloxyacyl hydrolase [Flavisolibacter sp.]